jgi:hypothetical protein
MFGKAALPYKGFEIPVATTTPQALSKLWLMYVITPLVLEIGPTEVIPSEMNNVGAACRERAATSPDKTGTNLSTILIKTLRF